MAGGDRTKWNQKWAAREFGTEHQSAILDLVADHAPAGGRLLDVAGGASHTSTELARLGFEVTVLDVSDVGLAMAEDAALAADVKILTIEADLESEPLPVGPWDVITLANYLQTDLFSAMADALVPGGLLVVVIATVANLERNERPGRPFLVEPDQLPRLTEGLDLIHHSEAWRANGRHEAHLVAQKPI